MGEEEEEATTNTTTTTTDKVTFFTELEKLDALTDSQDQAEDDFSRLIALSKRKADSVDALVPTSSSSSAALNTIHTTSRANTSIQSSSESLAEPQEDEEMARKPALKSAKTTGNICEDKPEGPPVKRRRTYAARTIPEQQQVFKGLVFCGVAPLSLWFLIKC